MRRLFMYFAGVFLIYLLGACAKKELVSHYERPEWLKGNIWEILEARGNFTKFLDGVERAGFKDVLNGKTIVTVFAPDDTAFEGYLSDRNVASIEQLSPQELKKIIGYHMVYYSYDKFMLQNYQPNGVTNSAPNRVGLHYKHRTRSQDTISVEVDKTDGRSKKIYHKDRFVPVLSQLHFQTKGIDAAENYEYFFGAGRWRGADGFNVANAGVTEYAIPADNGYVYIVDQVLSPLKTMYETIAGEDNFHDFLGVYDRFRTFTYDEQTSIDYAQAGDSLYTLSHSILPSIASEWTTDGLEGSYDYFDLDGLTYRAFNVFAPTNQALGAFFNNYFGAYYNSLQDVDLLPLALVMFNHVYQGNIVFPSEIGKNPDIKTPFGAPILFNPNTDVNQKAIASNGAFYGLNKVLVPDMFNSIMGPALRNPKYKIFMYMLYNSGMLQTLASRDIDYTLFIPSDEVVLNTLFGDSYLFWTEGNPLVFGDEAVLVENSDGVLVPLSQSRQETFVADHIAYGDISSLQETKVYRTRNPFSYLYTKGGTIYSSSAYNSFEGSSAQQIPGNWYNGKAYETKVALLGESGTIKFTLLGAESSSNSLHEYAEFSKLLVKAGLIEAGNSLSFLFGNRFLMFAPDNNIVLKGIEDGLIPSDKQELASYLQAYFVSVPDNSLSDYPFAGFGTQGVWNTALRTGYNQYRQIEMVDNGSSLELRDMDNTVIHIKNVFPKVFSDGAVYPITRLLKR